MAVKVRDKSVPLAGTALVIGCFLLAFHGTFLNLFRAWATNEDYSHGFLVIPLSLYLVWRKRRELASLEICPRNSGLLIIGTSLILYLLGVWARISTLSSLALVFTIWGLVVYLFGYNVAKRLRFPLFFLLFMIPIPSQIYASLTVPLQLLVTNLSTKVLDLGGLPVHAEGNVVLLPESRLQVVNACSGLRSMTSILTLGALFAHLTLRSIWAKSLLFLSGIPVSILVNITRIILLAVFSRLFAVNITSEPFHSLAGMAVFVLAFAFLVLFGFCLSWIEKSTASE